MCAFDCWSKAASLFRVIVTFGSIFSDSASNKMVESAGLSAKGAPRGPPARGVSSFAGGAFFISAFLTFGGVKGFDSSDNLGGSAGALSLSMEMPSGARTGGSEIVMDFLAGGGGAVTSLS